jgi:hypothetical protein
MPIYAYRCACGKTADVLVRGREPSTCDDVPELSGLCADAGALSRVVTAPYIGKGGGGGSGRATPASGESCGHCGSVPGSCES